MTLLDCRQLTRHPWFERLSFTLEAGEIVVLAAPSGSGKTLLLRAIADLDPLDSGDVLLRGTERRSLPAPEFRRRVVYVRQNAVGLGETVADDLDRIRHLSGSPRATEPAAGVALDRAVATLSGGELQRVALARALLVEPDVLLLDEPTAALDETASREVEERLTRWVAPERAALWVSHDTRLAERLGARVLSPW